MGRLVWKDLIVGKWFWLAGVPVYVLQLISVSDILPACLLLTFVGTGFFTFVSIGIEEIQGTESLWNSLPMSRGQVVGARYLASILGIAFGLGVSWIVALTTPAWIGPDTTASTSHLGLGAYMSLAFVLLMLTALLLPCLFRFGVGRGLQVFGAIGVGGLLFLSIAASTIAFLTGGTDALAALRSPSSEQLAAAERWLDAWGRGLLMALTGGALVITAWSAMLSVQLYQARD